MPSDEETIEGEPRDREDLDSDPRPRLTLNFQGPPLVLPEESSHIPAILPEIPPWRPPSKESIGTRDAWSSGKEPDGQTASEGIAEEDEPDGDTRLSSHAVDRPSQDWRNSDSNHAIELVDRNRPSSPGLDLRSEMAEKFALGDFTGSLRAAELLLGVDSEDAQALHHANSSRIHLEQLYVARLGRLSWIPRVCVPDSEVRWLGLDHRAGFLMSRIDGLISLEQLLELSGMERLEALKMLCELCDNSAIELREPLKT
ncbi:MAG: hypothetical protein AAF550_05955 [Myxococcota bacterium]